MSRKLFSCHGQEIIYNGIMSEPHNLILEHLRHIRAVQDNHSQDFRDVKDRLTRVELGMAAVRREIAGLAEVDALMQVHIDRFGERFGRVERRLDIDDSLSPLPI